MVAKITVPIVVAVLAALVWGVTVGFQAGPKSTLFLNLTTNDAWTNEMALSYAGKAMNAGHDVAIFLNVRAVQVARKSPPADLAKANEMLVDLQKKGAKVFVCIACTQRAGFKPVDDWIEGSIPGGDETIQIQMSPTTSVMSY